MRLILYLVFLLLHFIIAIVSTEAQNKKTESLEACTEYAKSRNDKALDYKKQVCKEKEYKRIKKISIFKENDDNVNEKFSKYSKTFNKVKNRNDNDDDDDDDDKILKNKKDGSNRYEKNKKYATQIIEESDESTENDIGISKVTPKKVKKENGDRSDNRKNKFSSKNNYIDSDEESNISKRKDKKIKRIKFSNGDEDKDSRDELIKTKYKYNHESETTAPKHFKKNNMKYDDDNSEEGDQNNKPKRKSIKNNGHENESHGKAKKNIKDNFELQIDEHVMKVQYKKKNKNIKNGTEKKLKSLKRSRNNNSAEDTVESTELATAQDETDFNENKSDSDDTDEDNSNENHNDKTKSIDNDDNENNTENDDDSDEDDNDSKENFLKNKQVKSSDSDEDASEESDEGSIDQQKRKYIKVSIKYRHEKNKNHASLDDNILKKIHGVKNRKYGTGDEDDFKSSEEESSPKRFRYTADEEDY